MKQLVGSCVGILSFLRRSGLFLTFGWMLRGSDSARCCSSTPRSARGPLDVPCLQPTPRHAYAPQLHNPQGEGMQWALSLARPSTDGSQSARSLRRYDVIRHGQSSLTSEPVTKMPNKIFILMTPRLVRKQFDLCSQEMGTLPAGARVHIVDTRRTTGGGTRARVVLVGRNKPLGWLTSKTDRGVLTLRVHDAEVGLPPPPVVNPFAVDVSATATHQPLLPTGYSPRGRDRSPRAITADAAFRSMSARSSSMDSARGPSSGSAQCSSAGMMSSSGSGRIGSGKSSRGTYCTQFRDSWGGHYSPRRGPFSPRREGEKRDASRRPKDFAPAWQAPANMWQAKLGLKNVQANLKDAIEVKRSEAEKEAETTGFKGVVNQAVKQAKAPPKLLDSSRLDTIGADFSKRIADLEAKLASGEHSCLT